VIVATPATFPVVIAVAPTVRAVVIVVTPAVCAVVIVVTPAMLAVALPHAGVASRRRHDPGHAHHQRQAGEGKSLHAAAHESSSRCRTAKRCGGSTLDRTLSQCAQQPAVNAAERRTQSRWQITVQL
jgi:hypothetical protein